MSISRARQGRLGRAFGTESCISAELERGGVHLRRVWFVRGLWRDLVAAGAVELEGPLLAYTAYFA
jgi:hypothetical protein